MMQKRNVLSKIVSCSLAFALLVTTLTTNELVANAEGLNTKGLFDSEPDVVEANSIEEVSLKDTVDTDSDSDYKSCRLIIFSSDNLEFEDAKSVTKYEGKYFVEYKNPKTTEEAYKSFIGKGIEVEIDVVQDTPEDDENKDDKDKEVSDKEIAKTNDKDKPTESIEMAKKNDNEDKNIVVAVLDTGLNVGEDVFTDRVIEGKNFVDEGKEANTEDINGHGTSMARVVLDNVAVENADSNIKIMPIKVLNDEGNGTTLTAYQGIKYAIEKKVDVINLSMSGVGQSKLLTSAINEAYNNGIPVVVSAGNDNQDAAKYTPANIKSAFTISSANKIEKGEEVSFEKAFYSNYGSVDFSANGVHEFTRTIDNKEVITKVEGTSVSSAYVTSYIALLKMMALSDEDDNNDTLSITDINNSFLQSAIKLEDTQSFGEGYLSKENLVLTKERVKDDSLKVDIISAKDLEENIDLNISESGRIHHREVYVFGFDPNTDWQICLYEVTDNKGQAAAEYGANTEIDSKTIGKNSYTEMTIFGGGLMKMWTYDAYAKIEWNDVLLQDTTTWCRAWLDLNQREFEYTEYIDHWGNSSQDDAPPYQYQNVTLDRWIDVYMGIGFKDKDVLFHSHPIHRFQNFKVSYVPWGGTWSNGDYNTIREFEYNENGTNIFGVGVGNEAPKRDGYIFKGWYFSNSNYLEPQHGLTHSITNFIDYANRHLSVRNAYGYTLNKLWEHMVNNNDWDYSEYSRSYADWHGPDEWTTDIFNNIVPDYTYANPNGQFDAYRQLLPANTFIAINHLYEGEQIVAHAVWEKAPGFSVTYDANGGNMTNKDGKITSQETVTYDANGHNEKYGLVGWDNTPVKKDENGKDLKFKGWFLVDDTTSNTLENKTTDGFVTSLIEYRHENPDLAVLDTVLFDTYHMPNMTNLWQHWNQNGQYEVNQPNSARVAYKGIPTTMKDMEATQYNNYEILLKDKEHLCGFHREGVFSIPNMKYRAIAIWEEDDGKRTITYNLNGAGARNDYRNPTSYTKEDNVTIYPLAAWHDNDYDYTFAGWTCDKNPPGNVNSAKNPSYSWTKQDYGDLVLNAKWNMKKRDLPPIGTFNYNIIWDSNGNWQDGRNDTELKTYNHSTNTTWSWSSTSRWKDDEGWHSDHDSNSGDYDTQSNLETYETPDTPRTATLYFDDPNAHGNTSDISAPIKTKKRFDEWQKVKSKTLQPDTSGDYNRSGNGWSEYFRTYTGSTNYYYHSYYSGEGWSDSYTERENERSTSKYYRADNPWKPNGKFRDLFNCCTETTLRAHWTRLPETLPSVSKEGYDFLGWQINGTGRIYRAGEQYTVGEDDNDVTFVAVWRRNQGKVVYNPNGATYDNNQPYSKQSDNQNTMLINGYTTKSGNIFGNEAQKNEYVTRDPQKSNDPTKYIYYKTDKGTITNRMGTENELASFQGWSAITYARYDTPSILYNGYFKPFMNMYYDVTAVNKLNIINPPKTLNSNTVKARESQIVQHRNNNISKWKSTPRLSEIGDWFERLTTAKLYYDPSLEGNGIINVYATWDYYPQFNNCPDSVSVTSDFITHLNTSNAEQQILNRIIEKDKVTITDVEDGNLKPKKNAQTKEIEMNEYVHIVNFNLAELQELAKNKTGSTTVTLQVHDNAGNVTEKFVTLWINQSVSAESYSSGNVIDGYTRFINKNSYNAPFEKGGLLDNSDWKLNPEYKQLLLNAFDRIDSNTPIETWEFTKDDAKDAQEFVKNNGLGNSLSPNGLADYLSLIKDNNQHTRINR